MYREKLPPEWNQVRLGQIVVQMDERVGKGPVPVVLSCTKHYGLVPSDEFFGRRIYSNDLSNYRIVRRDWFAYATNHLNEGSIGLQSDYASGAVSPMYTVFSVTDRADERFLWHLVKSPFLLTEYLNLDRGTVNRRGAIRFSDFAEIFVHLPPLPEQQRIAEILDTADEAIASTERIIAKLKQIKAGLLHDLLTRGLDERGQLRDPVAHPEQFVDSPLGRIPREWEIVPIGELGQWKGGSTPSKAAPRNWDKGSIPWVTPKDFIDVEMADSQDRITEKALHSTQITLHEPGCVLVVFRSGILRHTVPIALARVPLTVNQDVKALFCRAEVHNRFALYALQFLSPEILSLSVKAGTTVESIDSKTFFSMRLGVPAPTEQSRIAEILDSHDARIRAEEAYRDKLKQLKRGLMHDLLTGVVRVKVEG